MPEDEIASLPAEFSVESVEKLRVPQLDGERHLVVIKPNKILIFIKKIEKKRFFGC
ncbi:rRNA small subunit methyltransferase, glucose inhibited division protein GidB [Citrobacter freundii]|uniref:rRNA small subunit methyltransferase, glucose inhibited division protein GidB n=1 Tax=Citrobacter freundii TaxID=546 RepID=A0A7G2IU93_CITFR|nr:rRNA small subunit methyltransferase, glucose inhibited division protein GidB [Citrobacter freundii]